MLLVFNRLFRRIFRWLLVLRVKQTCVLCMQLYAQHLQGSYICSISKNEQNMRYMHKYITYATYAKTHQIFNICKNISNMQNMQKHIKYAKYVKHIKYAIYAKNTKICKNMHNHTIYGLLHIYALYAPGPGRPAKSKPGGVHILNVFVSICGICRKMRRSAYI